MADLQFPSSAFSIPVRLFEGSQDQLAFPSAAMPRELPLATKPQPFQLAAVQESVNLAPEGQFAYGLRQPPFLEFLDISRPAMSKKGFQVVATHARRRSFQQCRIACEEPFK